MGMIAAPFAASATACDGPASHASASRASSGHEFAVSEPHSPRSAPAPSRHCDGSTLPECEGGFTGPSCDLPCSPTSPGPNVPVDCSFELYCHGDGSVYGLAAKGALLYPGSPHASADEALAALVAFVTTHEDDLGLAPGLEPHDLGLAPAPGFAQRMGGLVVHRFTQTYRSRPVLPPDDLVQVVYGPTGAIQLTGQIIDGRRNYDHHDQHARESLVEGSIRHHAHVRTGLAPTELTVDPPTLVAMPGPHAIAWMAQVRHVGGGVLARVIVDASPSPTGPILPLLSWRPMEVADLASTTPIAVLTVDPATDPATPNTGVASQMVDGGTLLGSMDDVSGKVQLATDPVVVLDLNGGSEDQLESVGSRVLSQTGEFLAGSGPTFAGQVTYHLLRSWHARIDDYLTEPGSNVKHWDSALPAYAPGAQSPTPPGTFTPRVLALVNSAGQDCPPTAVACADIGSYMFSDPPAMVFPEIAHQPPGAAPDYEITGQIHTHAPGEIGNDITTLSHEFGHTVDLFAGPGFTKDIAPDCGDACISECVEDSSDEAPPLGETIAQMTGMLLLHDSFDPVDFEYCDIVGLLSRTNVKAFDPGPCIPPEEDISLLERPGSCSKSDPYCDKPDELGFRLECCDPAVDTDCIVDAPSDCPATGYQRQVPTGLCHTSPGYDTHSILQAFWQLLNGQHCEPAAPFDCQPYAWPGGISPADAMVPAFLHSLRLNPLSYEQLFDGMMTYVACTHGSDAYEAANAVLCNHGIRACNDPPPIVCETCGNGVREGGETCDGLDWAAASCGDFDGYVDGDLSCDAASCQLSLDGCISSTDDGGLDSTAGTSMGGTTDSDGSGPPAPAADGTGGPSTGPGDGGSGGCECRVNSTSTSGAWLLALLGALAHRRRRRSWPTRT